MVSRRFFLAALVWAGGLGLARSARADLPDPASQHPTAARVVLVANSADPDSLRIARHYAEVRGVPAENIIAFKMPLTEEITREEFTTQVWQPLQDALVAARWIDGIAIGDPAPGQPRRYAMNGHRIAALVVCRGVPLKVQRARSVAEEVGTRSKNVELQTSAAAVDSEFSLLAHGPFETIGVVPNPLFQREHVSGFDRSQVVIVSRLDGPTAENALGLVDRAVAAERTGIAGRAYVDLSGRHPDGDRWLEATAAQLTALGFDTDIDRAPTTMKAGARADAAIFYFGWYSENVDGPFALPNYRFPLGAVALHIHSFSAVTLRSATSGWAGPLIAHGATITFGNVYEPYLQLTVRPDLFVRALARGMTVGEAYVFAIPVLSWQGILLGDPLYQPLARSVADQWEERATLSRLARSYLAIRRLRLAEAAPDHAGAKALAETAWQETATLPLALELATAAEKRGETRAAAKYLADATPLSADNAASFGLLHQAAEKMVALQERGPALELYRRLLAAELPRELRLAYLDDAIALARREDPAASESWSRERSRLTGGARD